MKHIIHPDIVQVLMAINGRNVFTKNDLIVSLGDTALQSTLDCLVDNNVLQVETLVRGTKVYSFNNRAAMVKILDLRELLLVSTNPSDHKTLRDEYEC